MEINSFLKNLVNHKRGKYKELAVEIKSIAESSNFCINRPKVLTMLMISDLGNTELGFLSQEMRFLKEYIENNENDNLLKKYIKELYDFVEVEVIRIEHMKRIDGKTEEYKWDLLNRLEIKDKELENIKENSELELQKLKDEIKNVDEEAMKKMGMYLSVFTLIAGNISVLFKGVEVSPLELAGLIFIANSILVISIRTLFYFVNKDKKVSGYTIIWHSIMIILGIICIIFSSTKTNNFIKRNIENNIKNEYKYRFENYDRKLSEYKQENYILRLENENLKSRVDKIEKANLKNKK